MLIQIVSDLVHGLLHVRRDLFDLGCELDELSID
jgi:hypothetical protein